MVMFFYVNADRAHSAAALEALATLAALEALARQALQILIS